MFTSCIDANRIITQPLLTTFSRDVVRPGLTAKYVYGEDVGFAYYTYTRRRTKVYEYIGLSAAAAKSEAQRIWLAYRRQCYEWEPDLHEHKWVRPQALQSSSGKTATTDGFVVEAAKVAAARVDGCLWKVAVNVDESITIPYRPIGSNSSHVDDLMFPWTEFEDDPNLVTSAFGGIKLTDPNDPDVELDFGYDY